MLIEKSVISCERKLLSVEVKMNQLDFYLSFFLGVFSGLSSTVFSFIYQDYLLKRTMALWTSTQTQLLKYSIRIQLGEKVELIAKTLI